MSRAKRRSDPLDVARALVRRWPPVHRMARAGLRAWNRLLIRTHIRELGTCLRGAIRTRTTREAGGQPRRFVIFAQGRSGSSLLLDLIRSHPDVHCDNEIFHRRVAGRLFSPWRYINGRAALSPKGVYGCQLKIYQMTEDQNIEDAAAFLRRLDEAGWKIIHLVRENLFRKSLSLAVAEVRGKFLDRAAEGPVNLAALVVDPKRLLAIMRERERFDREEAAALDGIPSLRITYESDLRDSHRHQVTCDRIFDFLGVPRVSVSTELVRTSSPRISDYIANHEEIFEGLAGTEYAEYARSRAEPE